MLPVAGSRNRIVVIVVLCALSTHTRLEVKNGEGARAGRKN